MTRRPNYHGTDFVMNRQQDTADFMTSLLTCIQDDLNEVEAERYTKLLNCTIIEELKCSSELCSQTDSRVIEYPFYLPVPAFNSDNINQSLKLLLRENEKRLRDCPQENCTERYAFASTKIESLPRTLILQLQRFTFEANVEKKLSADISVPIRYQPIEEGPNYELTGAIIHIGNTTASGHFVSIIRCPESGLLFRCSDSQHPTHVAQYELNQAYMLVYSQIDENVQSNPAESRPARKKRRTDTDFQTTAKDFPTMNNDSNSQHSDEEGEASSTGVESTTDHHMAQESHRHQDPGTNDSRFEELIKKMTSARLNEIIDTLGVKRQNSFERRQKDLRTFYAKNNLDQNRIIKVMEAPVADGSNQQNKESGDTQSPTSHVKQNVSIDNLLNVVDGATLSRILRSFDVKPQSSLARRHLQLRNLYAKPGSIQSEILAELQNASKEMIYDSTEDIFQMCSPQTEKVINQEIDNAGGLGPEGDTEPGTNRNNHESQEESNTELPSPQYVPLFQHRASNAAAAPESEDISGNKWSVETWDRKFLLDYIAEHQIVTTQTATSKIRDIVSRHLFNSLISEFDSEKLQILLLKYNLSKHRAIYRQKGQLRSYFLKNTNCQNEILNFLEKNKKQTEPAFAEPAYANDFLPPNLEEILQKKAEIKADRVIRNEGLKSGTFRLISGPGPNPILEAGREMHQALREIKPEFCLVCKNQWFDLKIGPINGKCQRCAGERLKNSMPHTFSPENDMHPGLPPTSLSILNSVEVASISLICPQLTIYKLRGGASGMKGHSIAFYQDVQGFVDKLPRRPEDLPIIVIKAPYQNVELKANRHNILNALEFLKQHNPEYKNISIDPEALDCYPPDSQTPVLNIPTCDETEISDVLPPEPMETLDDNTGVVDDSDLVQTAAPFEMPTRLASEQIRQAILGNNNRPADLNWPERSGPASEWEYAYFSKAFPNLFPYGRGDLTKPRIGKNPEFLQYIRHLTRLPGTQFAEDPRFLLHVTSMYRRHKALTLGNVFASNVFKDMTMTELKEKVAQDDVAVMKSLVLFSGQIPGTKGYFSQEAKKSVAMERWIRLKSNGDEMLNVFLTFSLPDQHLEDLHRLLPGHEQYLGKTVVQNLSDIPPDADLSRYIEEKNRLSSAQQGCAQQRPHCRLVWNKEDERAFGKSTKGHARYH